MVSIGPMSGHEKKDDNIQTAGDFLNSGLLSFSRRDRQSWCMKARIYV